MTTKNRKTKHYVHPEHQTETEKTILANKTDCFGMPFTASGWEMEQALFLQPRSLHRASSNRRLLH